MLKVRLWKGMNEMNMEQNYPLMAMKRRNILLLFVFGIVVLSTLLMCVNNTNPTLNDNINSFDKDYHLYVKLNVTHPINESICILSFHTSYFSDDVVFLEVLSNNSNRYILSYENNVLLYRRYFDGTLNRFNLRLLIDSCDTSYIGIWSIYVTEVPLLDNIFIGLYSVNMDYVP